MGALSSCPFCGADESLDVVSIETGFYVECTQEGGGCDATGPLRYSTSRAAQAWNMRTSGKGFRASSRQFKQTRKKRQASVNARQCPFCGCMNAMTVVEDSVVCLEDFGGCGATGPMAGEEARAIEAWNKRCC